MNILSSHTPKQNAFLIASVAFLLAILLDALFYRALPGISVPIFCAVFLGALAFMDARSHRRFGKRAGVLSMIMFVLSLTFALRADPFLLFLNGCVMLYAFLHLLETLYGFTLKTQSLVEYFLFPLTDIFLPTMQSLDLFPSILRSSPKKKIGRILLGIALALPVLLVFLGLFASADPLFSKWLVSVMNQLQLSTVFTHVFIVGCMTVLFAAVFGPAFWKQIQTNAPKTQASAPSLTIGIETLVVFGLTNLVFFLFLMSQVVSAFFHETYLMELGTTYAEYARQGFLQLLVASALVIGMIVLARLVAFTRMELLGRLFQGTLLVQTGIILASAWMRLSSYEIAYGFTQPRLYGHAVMIAVAGILLLLFVNLLWRTRSTTLFEHALLIGLTVLFGLNIVNPDLLIANQNISRDLQGTTELGVPIDTDYLLNLSDDAAPVVIPYLSGMTQKLPAINEYDDLIDSKMFPNILNRSTPTSWRSWNLSRARAQTLREQFEAQNL